MGQWYTRLGFGQKIQLLINLVSISVLLLAMFFIGISFYAKFKENLEYRAFQKSNLIANAAAVGVIFDQSESINRLLASLKFDKSVSSATIYKKYNDGIYGYLGHYSRDNVSADLLPKQSGPVKNWLTNSFVLRLPVMIDEEEVGRLVLVEDNTYLKDFVSSSVEYMIPIILFSSLLIWLLSRSIQYRLAKPLKDLNKAVNEVSENRNYATNVEINSDDELGELGHSFNQMLNEMGEYEAFRIEKEREIVQLNAELEEKVYDRTKELTRSINDLRLTQQQLVEQEKMASLGELVAGVAHEINTPIGVGITAVSHLEENVSKIRSAFEMGSLTKKEFGLMLESVSESSIIVESNLRRAADLVKAFKSVAVDQSSAAPRVFNLNDYMQDILTSLGPKLKRTKHKIKIDIQKDIQLYCDPGIISQVITNLLMNSLHHAYSAKDEGLININATQDQHQFRLMYIDDGQGIEPDILARLFDPFVTTKRGQGGSGLGTHIIYNLVTQALYGRIRCFSEIGHGARFEIEVPVNKLSLPEKV